MPLSIAQVIMKKQRLESLGYEATSKLIIDQWKELTWLGENLSLYTLNDDSYLLRDSIFNKTIILDKPTISIAHSLIHDTFDEIHGQVTTNYDNGLMQFSDGSGLMPTCDDIELSYVIEDCEPILTFCDEHTFGLELLGYHSFVVEHAESAVTNNFEGEYESIDTYLKDLHDIHPKIAKYIDFKKMAEDFNSEGDFYLIETEDGSFLFRS